MARNDLDAAVEEYCGVGGLIGVLTPVLIGGVWYPLLFGSNPCKIGGPVD